jgi:hypothetical protein
MSQTLNSVHAFDGTNYGYWKARIRFFLKSIDVWKIVESIWIKLEDTTNELTVAQTSARLSNDKALQMLISRFGEIKMLEDETFSEF